MTASSVVQRSLHDRMEVHRESFHLEPREKLYFRRGEGPSVSVDRHIPQPGCCVLRRLLTRSYVWNRYHPESETKDLWPIEPAESVVVIDLRGETICFRMASLVFFDSSIKLRTIVNSQLCWAAFESPFIATASGFGRLAFRIKGAPIIHGGAPERSSVESRSGRVVPSRMVAWSSDTVLVPAVYGGVFNAWTFAEVAYRVEQTSLMLELRREGGVASDASLLSRVARLFVP